MISSTCHAVIFEAHTTHTVGEERVPEKQLQKALSTVQKAL